MFFFYYVLICFYFGLWISVGKEVYFRTLKIGYSANTLPVYWSLPAVQVSAISSK